jgi:hypothetical protein
VRFQERHEVVGVTVVNGEYRNLEKMAAAALAVDQV